MANVNIKTDFVDGEKLYGQQLNNNFATIKAALAEMNKIVWQDSDGVGVSIFKGNSVAIENRQLIEGQLLYNTETGETYIDTKIDDELKRVSTGSGNVIAIGENEPTNLATKLWIENEIADTMKYRNNSGEWKELHVKASDTLPIGSIVDFNGDEIPDGWEKADAQFKVVYTRDVNQRIEGNSDFYGLENDATSVIPSGYKMLAPLFIKMIGEFHSCVHAHFEYITGNKIGIAGYNPTNNIANVTFNICILCIKE